MATANPCPPPGRHYQAALTSVPYEISITIADSAWASVPESERLLAVSILNNQPISILNIGGRGNGIKRESDGWTIHTQTNKSLYDRDRSHAQMSNKTFIFDEYRKRPHG